MRAEQMRIYQAVAELARETDQILPTLPRRARYLAEHLKRSVESAGLNLSEGLTVYKPKVKASAFDIARKELGEVRKAIARLIDSKAGPAARMKRSDYLADCSIGMLTNMIKQQEARRDD